MKLLGDRDGDVDEANRKYAIHNDKIAKLFGNLGGKRKSRCNQSISVLLLNCFNPFMNKRVIMNVLVLGMAAISIASSVLIIRLDECKEFLPNHYLFERSNDVCERLQQQSGIFKYNNHEYEEIMKNQHKDYYYFKNRKQYPQVSFEDVDEKEKGKDVILMFEDRVEFRYIWHPHELSEATAAYKYLQIPCNNYGVKSCVVTFEKEYAVKANAFIQISTLTDHRYITVNKNTNQAFIGFYTESDDIGCQKKEFDAKLSYSPDATIKFNDNCHVVKLMYKCMGRAVHIMSNKEGLTQKEINRWKRKLYQYCVLHSNESDEQTEKNAIDYHIAIQADVAVFVSNCIQPRANFIEALVAASSISDGLKTSSYGKCFNNQPSDDDKISASFKHKFLFAMENKIKRDYVTEKIFQAYAAGIVPIYQGAPNIFDFAPNGSFVGVHSFAKPEALVDYITKLSKDEEAYDEFFDWDFDAWLQAPHTIQCLQIEAEKPLDAGWCSTCDWVANVFPHMKKEGKRNCDMKEYAPYFGYPRNPLAYKEKYK